MGKHPRAFVSVFGLALTMAGFSCNSSSGTSENAGGAGASGSTSQGGSSASGGKSTASSSSNGGGSGGRASSSSKSTSSGDGSAITSIDGGKTIGSLSSSEADQLCKDAYAHYDKTISQEALCKWTGLAYTISSSPIDDPMMQDNCKQAESSCLKVGAFVPSCRPLPPTCKGTVAQFTTCIADRAASYTSGVAALTTCA